MFASIAKAVEQARRRKKVLELLVKNMVKFAARQAFEVNSVDQFFCRTLRTVRFGIDKSHVVRKAELGLAPVRL